MRLVPLWMPLIKGRHLLYRARGQIIFAQADAQIKGALHMRRAFDV